MIARKDFIYVFIKDIVAVDTKIINSYVEEWATRIVRTDMSRMFPSHARDTIAVAFGYVSCRSRGLLQ